MRKITHLITLTSAFLFLFMMQQCKNKSKAQTAPASAAAQQATPQKQQQGTIPLKQEKQQPKAAAAQHLGTKEIPGDIRAKCPDFKMVTRADASPEGVIFKAYQAVLQNDLDTFIACFEPHRNPTEIERYYWKNVKKYIGKYTKSPKDASYGVCRKQDLGNGLIKIFVVSKDPRKSHPPIILKQIKGQWRITFFTP